MTSSKTYYFTTVLRTIFTEKRVGGTGDRPTYDDIANFDDFWDVSSNEKNIISLKSLASFQVMSEPVLNGLFDQKWYNGEDLTESQYGYVLFENKILGLPRLRQLRVTNHSCKVHEKFQTIIPDCYGVYSGGRENRTTYKPENVSLTSNA